MKPGRKPQPRRQKQLHATLDRRWDRREPEAPSGPFEPDSFIRAPAVRYADLEEPARQRAARTFGAD